MSRWRLAFALAVALVMALGGALSAFALNETRNLELDRNAIDAADNPGTPSTLGDDWDSLFGYANPAQPTSELAKVFVPDGVDPADTTYFAGGGSKDDLDVSNWGWSTKDVAPDKDEITNAYAAAYLNALAVGANQVGDFIIYFGADRYANNGSSQMGFWFFRNAVGQNADGTFSGGHAVGDLLVLADFEGGGDDITVDVYEWVGSGGSDGTLNKLFSGVDCTSQQHSIACATVNTGDATAPWAFTPKFGTTGVFPDGSFLEGGLNVSAALRRAGLPTDGVCFTSFLAETRSSHEVNAQLKDFALGNLNSCGSLTVTKDASTTFTRTFGWTIDKSVTPDTWNLFTGDSGTSRYTVALTKDAGTDSNWAVSGNISVQNTGLTTARVTGVTDELTGGIAATVVCPVTFPYDLAVGASLNCTYSSPLPDGSNRTNTATATTSGLVGGDSGTAAVTFGAPTTTVNDTVNVTDTYSGSLGSFSASGSTTYDRTFTCDTDEGTHNNTATIVETSQSDSAQVTVNCYALSVTKDASTSLTRTFGWTIDKSVTPETWNMFTGDSGTSRYTIALTKDNGTDSGFAVSGNIAVQNPAPMAATINSVADLVSPNIVANVVGAPAFPYSLAAGATLNLTYNAALPDSSGRTNTATATLQNYSYSHQLQATPGGTTDFTGTANVSFASPTVTLVNDSVSVDDTNPAGDAGPFGDDTSYTYDRTFTCDTDEGTHNNTATIVETGQSDSASVTVNCYALAVTKDASTSLTRTWTWTIDKSADQSSVTLTAGQQFLVNYSVVVNATSADSNWAVSGNIAVQNPAPVAAVINSVVDVVSGVGNATVSGASFPYTLAAGATLNLTYTLALPNADARTNTATATLQNHDYDYTGAGTADGTTDFSGSANVSFASATVNQVDECIDVSDTYAGSLGTVCAGVDSLPKTFTYTRTLQFTAEQCGQQTVPNTASFVTNDTGATGSDNWQVVITVQCAFEGFTPGYWKNHLDQWAATGFSPNQTLESVFNVPDAYGLDNYTLLQALDFEGGSDNTGAARILLRAAVAALLNSAHPGVDYPLTTASVISQVNAALASNDRNTILALASQLDGYNNLGGSIP